MRERWTRNKKMYLCVCILAVFVFILNCMTPYIADDFQYMFSFKTGERITSISQIFPSLYVHYMNDIGRMIPHFFAQLFLMEPKWIFNVFNTVCFVGMVFLWMSSCKENRGFSSILWFCVPVLLWQFVPCFGQIFLWEDGSFNYLWVYLFATVYLIPYIKLFLEDRDIIRKTGYKVAFCSFAFLFGNCSENVSFSVIFIGFLMAAAVAYRNRKIRQYVHFMIPVVCGACGYLIMVLSPGEATHVGWRGLADVIKSMIQIGEDFYATQKTMLVLWAVLMVAVIYLKRNRRMVAFSVFLMVIACINVILLGFGSYYEPRALAAGAVFVIWANVVLLQLLRTKEHEGTSKAECIALCIGMYFIAGSLLNIWNGTYDIYETNCRNSAREQYIREQAAAGVQEMTVAQIEPATTYCGKYGVADIFTKEQNAQWLNKAIAKYYGLDMIYGESTNEK